MTREEAIKKIKAWEFLDNDKKEVLETLIPELAESKDERIRKELLESFKYQQRESRTDKEWLNGIKLSEVVAWVEKQGEQKPKWGDDDEQYLLVCKNALHKYQVSDKWDADIISKWLDDKLKQGEQKPKWSDEDDYNAQCYIAKAERDIANGCTGRNKELIDWLKSLKQRMEGKV